MVNFNTHVTNNIQLPPTSSHTSPVSLQNTVQLNVNPQDTYNIGTRLSVAGEPTVNINDHIGPQANPNDTQALNAAAAGQEISIETNVVIGGGGGTTGSTSTTTGTGGAGTGVTGSGSTGTGSTVSTTTGTTGSTSTTTGTTGSASTTTGTTGSTSTTTGGAAAATSTAASKLSSDDQAHASPNQIIADGAAGYNSYKAAGGADDATTWRNNDLPASNVNASSILSSAVAAGPSILQTSNDASLRSNLNTLGVSTAAGSTGGTGSVSSAASTSVQASTVATSSAAAKLISDDQSHAGQNQVLADGAAGYNNYRAAGGTDDAATWRNKDLPASNVNASSVLASAVATGPSILQTSNDASLRNNLNTLGVSTGATGTGGTGIVASAAPSTTVATSSAAAAVLTDDKAHASQNKIIADAAAGFNNYRAAGGKDDAATWRNKDLAASNPNASSVLASAVATGPSILQTSRDATLGINLIDLGVSTGTLS